MPSKKGNIKHTNKRNRRIIEEDDAKIDYSDGKNKNIEDMDNIGSTETADDNITPSARYVDGEHNIIRSMSEKFGASFHIFNPIEYKPETHRYITIVEPHMRITSDMMQEYEYTEFVSFIAKSISEGVPTFSDTSIESDYIKKAEMELRSGKSHLAVRRMLTPHLAEEWGSWELTIPE